MKKRLSAILGAVFLICALVPVASAAKINVGKGEYAPFWSDTWTTDDTRGLWKGFYILKEDNTLRTDMVQKTVGEWGIPGQQNGMVWEGNSNACAPSDEADVGYLLNCVEGGKLQIILKGMMEVPGCTEITLGIYKNNFNTQVWPTSGGAQTLSEGQNVDIDIVTDVKKGDKLFFRFHSPVEVANSPNFRFADFKVIWKTSDQQGGTTTPSSTPATTTSKPPVTSKDPAVSSDPGASAPTEDPVTSTGDDDPIVIVDDDSYYVTPKFEDVTVDEDQDKITLTRKLTRKEFMESFTIKDGHTLELVDTGTTQVVTDDSVIVTSDMICRVYNRGTPVANLSIAVTYKEDGAAGGSNAGASGGLSPVVITLIVVAAVVVLAGAAVAVLLVLKKKGIIGRK